MDDALFVQHAIFCVAGDIVFQKGFCLLFRDVEDLEMDRILFPSAFRMDAVLASQRERVDVQLPDCKSRRSPAAFSA